MSVTTTITAEQRRGLYELVRNHLGGLNDVWVAMEHNPDFATAERLGLESRADRHAGRLRGPWRPGVRSAGRCPSILESTA